jgi:hypothetical protein
LSIPIKIALVSGENKSAASSPLEEPLEKGDLIDKIVDFVFLDSIEDPG